MDPFCIQNLPTDPQVKKLRKFIVQKLKGKIFKDEVFIEIIPFL